MKFLIIEDEEKIVKSLQKGLIEQHYKVDVAYDGEAGLALSEESPYQLIILDLMLPKLDGWSVLDKIRGRDKKTAILLLTALNAIPDRVRGLQAGADDYLAKPFAFSEFLARVEAILRRTVPVTHTDTFQIEDLVISFTSQTVTRNSQVIELAPKEFRLLCILAEHTGRLVSRKELSSKVWGLNFDCETNVLDVAIRRLRQKIDDPFETKLIHTTRGAGYALEKRHP